MDPHISAEVILRLDAVSFRRDGTAFLNTVSWEVRAGEQWAVIGPNGSGKTLLTQLIRGQLPPSSGSIVYAPGIASSDVARVSFELQGMILARERAFEPARDFGGREDEGTTVRQLLGGPRAGDGPSGSEVIETMALERFLDAPLVTLSNGEMRKILLCRALMRRPRLLVLDEPFDGLDVASRKLLGETLVKTAATGVALLMVTQHDDEIDAPITHVLGLEKGTVAISGKREFVLASPWARALAGEGRTAATTVNQPRAPVAERRTPGTNEPTIVMRNVTVRYGSRIVFEGLDWTVRRDEHWAIIGPNGCGKSTLLRLISADHLQAYSNDIELFGKPRGGGETIWEIKQRIGVLSPELQVAYREDLTVRQVVASGLFESNGVYRRLDETQKELVRRCLAGMGLEKSADGPYAGLSYGERRIVLLARALVKGPEMLLLDEPCQGLDSHNREKLIGLASMIPQHTGAQVLFVSHRPQEFPSCITHMLEFMPGGAGGSVAKERTIDARGG